MIKKDVLLYSIIKKKSINKQIFKIVKYAIYVNKQKFQQL